VLLVRPRRNRAFGEEIRGVENRYGLKIPRKKGKLSMNGLCVRLAGNRCGGEGARMLEHVVVLNK
jgi:hypothetical protein